MASVDSPAGLGEVLIKRFEGPEGLSRLLLAVRSHQLVADDEGPATKPWWHEWAVIADHCDDEHS